MAMQPFYIITSFNSSPCKGDDHKSRFNRNLPLEEKGKYVRLACREQNCIA
jgi:hypothetical protein